MLSRTLLHIYGPFNIYSYGVFIALGCMIIYWLISRDTRRIALVDTDRLLNIFSICIIAAAVGGRLLHLLGSSQTITSLYDIFALHEGGFSLLGSVLAILCVVPWYLKKNNIPVLPFTDLMALYAPLLQAISRLGCFFAGCCYGKPTQLFWGVTYVTEDTLAPRFCKLHPAQLYAAFGDLCIFLLLYFVLQKFLKKPGQLLCLYLSLSSLNRFFMDFFRDDREFLNIPAMRILSLHQWIALGIIISSIGYFIFITRKERIS